ncbi:opioid-binding protein/cell adhesion molecule [Elysia marginata]|uniref:Opioid-binding protein/cell adhesion molecule n=1 Tax=Elysia marginata TaxID=1093978 RepID=A0AAV4EBM7_9GAST|nr:opioid-binding protein/cell adhesion molecule [Elysia marginata]
MRQSQASEPVPLFFPPGLAYNKETRPVIDETPMTIRVITGQTASLPCSVDPRYTEQHADQYKVIWVNPLETAISLQDRRILNDDRMSVERPFLRDWNLHIRNVSLTDKGEYKCQINTTPVGTKRVQLVVVEPPSITDHTKPSDIERPEKDTIELFCNATGTPPPNITWYRLNKKTTKHREHVGQGGEVLVIHNVTKDCADTYECVADNKVGSAISHSFKITIQYAPEVHLPNTRLGQYLGKDTILECEVNASPLGTVLWKHNGRPMANSLTSEVNLYNKLDDSVILSLRLQQIKREDYGVYECYADNILGTTRQSMTLYEIVPRRKSTTTTTTEAANVWSNQQGVGHSRSNSLHKIDRGGNSRGGDDHGVRDGHSPHMYRPRGDSQDETIHSEDGRNYGPADGSSKYTSVIDSENDIRNESPKIKLEILASTVAMTAFLAVACVL